ncbi:asparaginase [Oerskovia flava]|uniref:asparaginase n=1 Tax=Oerskovia flava TaxID=2986422 RepID=UPI00224033B5|nr:asparaginase [Oerskovia sp. JB1-3-2]
MRTLTLTVPARFVAIALAAALAFAALVATIAYTVADSRSGAALAQAAGATQPVLASAQNPLGIASTSYRAATEKAAEGKPKVVVVATGGTLAGKATGRDTYTSYRAGTYLMDDLLDTLRPEIDAIADVSAVQFGNAGSSGYSIAQFHALTAEVEKQLETADAVVVTTGTDTQEEFAYWLDLTVQSRKPVITSGAMRPWGSGDTPAEDALFGSDGPANLYSSILLAASQQTFCFGTVLMLNDEIQAAREVTKSNSYRNDTFQSREYGVLGWIDGPNITLGRAPARVLACDTDEWFTPFDLDEIAASDLPRVEILMSYQQAGGEAVTAFAGAGVEGIVTAGTGAGGISSAMGQARTAAIRDHGVWFVTTTRTGSGSSYSAGNGVISGGDLTAVKARLLLLLSRAFTDDLDTARGWFASVGSPTFDQSEAAATTDPGPGAPDPVLFTGAAATTCIAKKPRVTLSVANTDTAPVDVTVTSPAGDHSFRTLAPGASTKHAFTLRDPELAAGEATFTATKIVDGQPIETVSTAAYPAITCP